MNNLNTTKVCIDYYKNKYKIQSIIEVINKIKI